MQPEASSPADVILEWIVAIPEVPSEPTAEGQGEPTLDVEGSGTQEEVAGPDGTARLPHVADPARRRALVPWLIGAGVVAVLGGIAFGLTYTPLFRADEIRVEGAGHLSEAKVLKIAGLGPDSNLLYADLAAAERRLERQPWISQATVTRSLPHTLDIQVVERAPVATAVTAGHRVLVSADGVALGGVPAVHALPIITSPEGSADLTRATLRVGAEASAAMPAGLRAQIESITVDAAGTISVRMRGGVLVTYGDDSQLDAKGQSLKAVLAWAARESRPLATVDVSVPGSPTARLIGGAVVAR